MRSLRPMFLTAPLLLLYACSGDTAAPGELDGLSANVRALRPRSSRISASLRDSTFTVGDTATLAVELRDRFGRDISRFVGAKFSSRDTNVATVSQKGLVAVVGEGSTWIVVRTSVDLRDSVAVGTVSRVLSEGIARSPIAPVEVEAVAPDPVLPASTPPAAPQPGLTSPDAPAPQEGGTTFNVPLLPAATVDVSVPAVTGRTIRVAAGDVAALQAAIDGAVGGDEIVLPNAAEFIGNLTLPRHAGLGAVTLRSESVPAVGARVTPSTSAGFARIVTTNSRPAIATLTAARNWRVIGLTFLQRNDVEMNYGIVRIGEGNETRLADFVSDIVLDRIFVSAGSRGSTRRCVGLNGNALAIVNSWLVECHSKGFDSQAVAGWTGMGPFLIANNHMEASSEHIVFGGGDPHVANVTPSDITIRGNYLFRPMAWANAGWLIKNIFELKHAKRLLFEGNILENNWIDGQVGFAILFQALSQDGHAPWSTIQDITVRNNIIKNSTSGINILSRVQIAGVTPTEPSRRILLSNNLFVDVGRDPVTGVAGRISQLLGDIEDMTVIRNTFVGSIATDVLVLAGLPQKRLTIRNNVFFPTLYGLFGQAKGEGTAALAEFAPKAIVEGNVFTGRAERLYPSENAFPATLSLSDFVNVAGGDYTLRAALPFSAHGRTLVGVDGQALLRATAGTIRR